MIRQCKTAYLTTDEKQMQANNICNACLFGLEPKPYQGLQSKTSQPLRIGKQTSNPIESVKGMLGDLELCEPAFTDSTQDAL